MYLDVPCPHISVTRAINLRKEFGCFVGRANTNVLQDGGGHTHKSTKPRILQWVYRLRWVKQNQNQMMTLAAAESDTRSDMKSLDLVRV